MSVFLNQFPSGEWQKNFIPFEEDASQRSWLMPYLFVHGKKPGHKITIIAAIHGDELNGVTLTRPDNQATAPICFVFTTSTGDPAKASRVAVHELTHVLELPHQCGFWDVHTNRAATCCMTYATQWALTGTARHHVDDTSMPGMVSSVERSSTWASGIS